jgi:hypothetical protein
MEMGVGVGMDMEVHQGLDQVVELVVSSPMRRVGL